MTQRGNGRAQTFFEEDDYALYRDLLGQHCAAAGVGVWAWVLMPNHAHLKIRRRIAGDAQPWRLDSTPERLAKPENVLYMFHVKRLSGA